MKRLLIASACLLGVAACARPSVRCDVRKETAVTAPEPDSVFERSVLGDELPPPSGPPEPVLACIVDQLSRSAPVQQAPHAIWTVTEAFQALKCLRPDRIYRRYTESGGYFIFTDAQVGSKQPTGSPYPYGLAFKKGDTAVYEWCHWGPEYITYVRNGATVADNFVCILNLAEWDWRERRPGNPKSLNGAVLLAGASFHVKARIVNLVQNQRKLSFNDWSEYGFLPHLELYRVDEPEPVRHALVSRSSKDDPRAWDGSKMRTTYEVPESAYGDYRPVLASLPPGTYRIIVSIGFTNGTLRSNPQEFTIKADH